MNIGLTIKLIYQFIPAVCCGAVLFFGIFHVSDENFYDFVALFLGPALFFFLAPHCLNRIYYRTQESGSDNIVSLVGELYDNSTPIWALSIIVVTISGILVIALQLKIVTLLFSDMYQHAGLLFSIITTSIVILGSLYSTQKTLLSSLVAISAMFGLLILCGIVLITLYGMISVSWQDIGMAQMALFTFIFSPFDFTVDIVIYGLSVICLPWMFHILISKCQNQNHLEYGKIIFTVWLVLCVTSLWLKLLASLSVELPDMTFLLVVGAVSLGFGLTVIALTTLQGIIHHVIVRFIGGKNPLSLWLSSTINPTLTVIQVMIMALMMVGGWLFQLHLSDTVHPIEIIRLSCALLSHLAIVIFLGLYSKNPQPLAATTYLVIALFFWYFNMAKPLLGETASRINSVEIMISFVFAGTGYLIISRFIGGLYRRPTSSIDHLREMLIGFVGEENSKKFLDTIDGSGNRLLSNKELDRAQKFLAQFIGVSTAKHLFTFFDSQNNLVEPFYVTEMLQSISHSLSRSYSLMKLTFDNVDIGITILDDRLNLVAWNQSYSRMHNYPDNFLKVGMPIDALRAPAMGLSQSSLDRYITSIKNSKSFREVINNEETNGFVIKVEGKPLSSRGYITTYENITTTFQTNAILEKKVRDRTIKIRKVNSELKREIQQHQITEDRLATTNNNRSLYISLLQHDIVQPLNAAMLYTNSLIKNNSRLSKVGKIANHINNSIHLAYMIISDALNISVDRDDKNAPPLTPILLDSLIQKTLNTVSFLISTKVKVSTDIGHFYVLSNEILLQRIVQNILTNSFKYTEHGQIKIKAIGKPKKVVVTITDTGIGIHPHDIKKIFEIHTRGRNAADTSGGGGLGLAIAYKFATQLGIKITCKSKVGRGSGSTFTLTLPKSSDLNELKSNASANSYNKSLSVLCIDEDPANLKALRSLLNSWGISKIKTIEDVSQINLPDSFTPNVVIIEYRLKHPRKNGYTVALSLARKFPKAIISITSSNRNLAVDTFTKRGFVFISKPINPAKLRAFLSSALINN